MPRCKIKYVRAGHKPVVAVHESVKSIAVASLSTSSTRSMSSAINWRSHHVQLITVAVSTCLVTAGALSAFQTISKRRKRKELEEEVRRAVGKLENGDASRQQPNAGSEKGRLEFSDHLIREQLARCYAVFQEEGMAKVRKARVVIVGCGGVGSWAAMMLVRSYVCIRKTSTFYRSNNEELDDKIAFTEASPSFDSWILTRSHCLL